MVKKELNPAEGVEYIDTLRCREFTISFKNLLKALKLPDENIVTVYAEGLNIHVSTDKIVKEKNVI